MAKKSHAAKQRALEWAKKHKVPLRSEIQGKVWELVDVNNNRPIYLTTFNRNASISTAADLVRQTFPYLADGDGFTVGIWDANSVLSTHRELIGRVTKKNDPVTNWHSTHVAGTIAATGIDYAAQGMAPAVDIDSYDWKADTAEMAYAAASSPGEPEKIYISNHSYGYVAGWDKINSDWYWYGVWDGANSYAYKFGQYNEFAKDYDEIAYNAPYYLAFKAAGNDRDNNPEEGETIYCYPNNDVNIPYSTSTCPLGDGEMKNGYDTIPDVGNSKNIMTIGAVTDAVQTVNGSKIRNVANGTMTSFSSWGPTDDGRIKPDIVANGSYLLSCTNTSSTDYIPKTGTSMATPNASGSAMLLVDLYDQFFPGQAMRSSTLKGLIIHTADDLGNPGPDYKFGWGLMNTKAAADIILAQSDLSCSEYWLTERLLDSGDDLEFVFYLSEPQDMKVTICWTDPPANSTTSHDNTTPRLKNDLDLRIVSADETQTFYPFVLDLANPSAAAITGDNTFDNIEQVYISSLSPGFYFIQVSHKGSLTDGQQNFSLISSTTFSKPVSIENLIQLVDNWLSNSSIGDFNCDGKIDVFDYVIISKYWLSESL